MAFVRTIDFEHVAMAPDATDFARVLMDPTARRLARVRFAYDPSPHYPMHLKNSWSELKHLVDGKWAQNGRDLVRA